MLFLIDEFLHGTNSHDRRIGAEALVRGLVERGAIGPDHHPRSGAGRHRRRAWASVPATCTSKIASKTAKSIFDYVMRPGVVRKSNAIELMRSVGLEI